MREVSHFVVVFPTRLMAASCEEKKAIMDALRRQYPHYEIEGMEAFDDGVADDDDFGVVPVMGRLGDGEGGDTSAVYMCRPLDPLVIPELLRALAEAERQPAMAH
jgi:hypothetical protein